MKQIVLAALLLLVIAAGAQAREICLITQNCNSTSLEATDDLGNRYWIVCLPNGQLIQARCVYGPRGGYNLSNAQRKAIGRVWLHWLDTGDPCMLVKWPR